MATSEVYYKGRSIPVPPEVAHAISLRAAEIVRQTAPRGPSNSRALVRATWQKGQIGVHIPPQAAHLIYLDQGIKPFLMTHLEGKTIPIRQPDGSIAFRRVKGVGTPKILSRDENGAIVTGKLKWAYPGVEPMNFIQPAIQQAISEWIQSIMKTPGAQSDQMMTMLQGMPGEIGKFFSRFKKTSNALRMVNNVSNRS